MIGKTATSVAAYKATPVQVLLRLDFDRSSQFCDQKTDETRFTSSGIFH